jgi:hypothetical protein
MKPKTPPFSTKKQKQEGKTGDTRRYIKHGSPEGLRRCLNRPMNQILACDDPLSHAGQYASLANAMTNSQKLSFDINDFQKLQAEVEELKEQMKKQ